MIASLTDLPGVAPRLLGYLENRLGVAGLDYACEPCPITHGWETYIYRFQLRSRPSLPAPFDRPLILRLYSNTCGLPRLRQDYAAQKHMVEVGYPVARPLLLEEDAGPFGGPFMVMEWLAGRPLLDLMLWRPWRIVCDPGLLAQWHARLHTLPAEGFPAPPGPFLDRHLEQMAALLERHGLSGLKPGLDWLHRHRPAPAEDPRIVHLDFHPMNLLWHRGDCSGIVDWCESDVGDRHADVATTIVLIRSAPVEAANFLQQFSTWPGRSLLLYGYLYSYRRRLPLHKPTLAYYIAWAAFRRLCGWGRWLQAGPDSTGSKPSCLHYLSPQRVDVLRHCFRAWANVTVRL